MARAFLDTNVVVYANDADDPERWGVAVGLLAALSHSGEGVVSSQVLVEYAAVALRKLGQAVAAIDEQIGFMAARYEVVGVTPDLIRRGLALAGVHRIHFYDALMVAAAESAECEVLYSEDLNAGQVYAGVTVVNPFAS